jgi:hypothetical protein
VLDRPTSEIGRLVEAALEEATVSLEIGEELLVALDLRLVQTGDRAVARLKESPQPPLFFHSLPVPTRLSNEPHGPIRGG